MELLPQPGPLVTTQAPSPGISPEQVAQPYRELSNTLAKTGEAAETVAENVAKQAGYRSVTMGQDGTLQLGKAPIIGPASQAFADAQKMAALAEGESSFRARDIQARQDHINDPAGYLEWANGFQQKTISDLTAAGAPEVGLALGKVIGSATDYSYRSLLNRKQETDLRTAANSIDTGIGAARDDAMALAWGGDTSSVGFKQAVDKFNALTEQKVGNPLLAYPEDVAQHDREQFAGQLGAAHFAYQARQIYTNAPSRTQGEVDATQFAQQVLTDPTLHLSMQQRQGYYNRIVGEIRTQEAIRKQDIADARGAFVQLREGAAFGVEISPEDVQGLRQAFQSAGYPAGVAEVDAAFSHLDLHDAFRNQPIPAQTDQINALRTASPTSGAEAMLIAHESGGNPRSVNKLGYAGLYQFGAPNLTDLGLYKPGAGENLADWSRTPATTPGKWSGTFNIPGFPDVKTINDFLANPGAQKAAFDAHTADMDAQIKGLGLDKYIGQNVAGVPITREGLHAMIHLGGAEGARVALQTGGAVNPQDANHTSLLDYARMAVQTNPASSMWLIANRSRTLNTEVKAQWGQVMSDWADGKGPPPSDQTAYDMLRGARATGDLDLQTRITQDLSVVDQVRASSQLSIPNQQAALTELKRQLATGDGSNVSAFVVKSLQANLDATVKGLQSSPISMTVQRFPNEFQTPAPLNLKDPNAFAAGLAQRAKIAQFAARNWQSGPVPALDAADLAQIKGALDGADPGGKAAIFQGLATLPPDVRGATLKKLGGDDPRTMAQAAAGSLMSSAPDVATSIFRGQMAMKADPKWDVTSEKGGKAAFDDDFGKALPSAIFPMAARTDPTGPYSTMNAMVKARYADLSAQTGDTTYSKDRVQQAVQDVTGGLVTLNDQKLIAPMRGMTQGQFEAVLAGVTDKDLAGVTSLNGQPVTAAYLRSNAQLESAGDGRYFVKLGKDPAKPIYAYSGANTEIPSKFVLDLRGRAPAPNYRPPAGVPVPMQ